MHNSSFKNVIAFIVVLLVKKRVFYLDDEFMQNIRKRKVERLIKKNSQVVVRPEGPEIPD